MPDNNKIAELTAEFSCPDDLESCYNAWTEYNLKIGLIKSRGLKASFANFCHEYTGEPIASLKDEWMSHDDTDEDDTNEDFEDWLWGEFQDVILESAMELHRRKFIRTKPETTEYTMFHIQLSSGRIKSIDLFLNVDGDELSYGIVTYIDGDSIKIDNELTEQMTETFNISL